MHYFNSSHIFWHCTCTAKCSCIITVLTGSYTYQHLWEDNSEVEPVQQSWSQAVDHKLTRQVYPDIHHSYTASVSPQTVHAAYSQGNTVIWTWWGQGRREMHRKAHPYQALRHLWYKRHSGDTMKWWKSKSFQHITVWNSNNKYLIPQCCNFHRVKNLTKIIPMLLIIFWGVGGQGQG